MTSGVDLDGTDAGPHAPADAPRPAPRRRSRHGRRRSWSTNDRAWAVGATTVAAVFGALGDAAPTGHPTIDMLERALFAVVFTVAVARARRWIWLLTGCSLTILGGLPIGLVGLVAALVAVGSLRDEQRSRPAGWVVATLGSFAVLRLPSWGPHGSTAAISTMLLLLAAGSAYRTLRSRSKRIVRRTATSALVAVVIATGLGVLALSYSRGDIEQAVQRAENSVNEAKAGRTEDAVREMQRSERRFRAVAARLSGVVGFGGRVVPVVAQHLDTVRRVAADGAEVSKAGVEVARAVDYRSLRREDGSLDLDRLRSYATPLADVRRALDDAVATIDGVASPWLMPPMRSALSDAGGRLASTRPGATVAADLVEVLPAILGGEGERRYLVLLMTTAEARDLGGHIGFYAEVAVDQGALRRVRSGPIRDLIHLDAPPPALAADRYPASFLEARPHLFPQNLGATPDLATTAAAAQELYPQLGGGPIDGVATVDPAGLAALLAVTGPVEVPGTGVTLHVGNAAGFLLRDQYTRFGNDAQDAFGRALVEQVADRLTAAPLTDISQLASALGEAAAGDHLRFTSLGSNGAEAAALARLGLGDGLRPVPAGSDGVALLVSNIGPNKLDAYLREEVNYEPVVDPASGSVEARLSVTLTNTAPDGLPAEVTGTVDGLPAGTHRVRLSLLTPFEAEEVRVNGRSEPFGTQTEAGRNRHVRSVDVARGATVTVDYLLRGRVDATDGYHLVWQQQPVAERPTVRVAVRDRSGSVWPCPLPDGVRSEQLTCHPS